MHRGIRYADNADISSRGESARDISGRSNGAAQRLAESGGAIKRVIFSPRRGYWDALRFTVISR